MNNYRDNAERKIIKDLHSYEFSKLGEHPPCPYSARVNSFEGEALLRDVYYCTKTNKLVEGICDCDIINSQGLPVYENYCGDKFEMDELFELLAGADDAFKPIIGITKRCIEER